MIQNLTAQSITVNQGSKIAEMAAVNVVLHMLAPQTPPQTETIPAKSTQRSPWFESNRYYAFEKCSCSEFVPSLKEMLCWWGNNLDLYFSASNTDHTGCSDTNCCSSSSEVPVYVQDKCSFVSMPKVT